RQSERSLKPFHTQQDRHETAAMLFCCMATTAHALRAAAERKRIITCLIQETPLKRILVFLSILLLSLPGLASAQDRPDRAGPPGGGGPPARPAPPQGGRPGPRPPNAGRPGPGPGAGGPNVQPPRPAPGGPAIQPIQRPGPRPPYQPGVRPPNFR